MMATGLGADAPVHLPAAYLQLKEHDYKNSARTQLQLRLHLQPFSSHRH